LGDVSLPPVKAGDLVMLGQAGAYGFTESMAPFLSHPQAAEYWYEGSPLASPVD
jgi:diaminopimelate decarboxylase